MSPSASDAPLCAHLSKKQCASPASSRQNTMRSPIRMKPTGLFFGISLDSSTAYQRFLIIGISLSSI